MNDDGRLGFTRARDLAVVAGRVADLLARLDTDGIRRANHG